MAYTEVDLATELFYPTGAYEGVLSGGSITRADPGDPDADGKGFDLVLLGVTVPDGMAMRVQVDCPVAVVVSLYAVSGDDQTAYDGSSFTPQGTTTLGGPPDAVADSVVEWTDAVQRYVLFNAYGPSAEITAMRYEFYVPPNPGDTDTSNALNGRVRGTVPAAGTIIVPVAPVPDGLDLGDRVDASMPYPVPVLDNGRVTNWANTQPFTKPAARQRILIDNVDVTFFRGSPTPLPRFMLTEPYAYGATDIQFPQVHAGLEMDKCGAAGELSWARPDARVVIQMVDDPMAETPTVLGTVYEGWVDDLEVSNGSLLNLACSGLVSGRLNWMYRPAPRFRKLADIGHWAALSAQAIGVAFSPFSGPVLGRNLADDGDMSELAWLDQVCQMSQQRDGRQWSFMPKGTWGSGVWQFTLKNTTIVHFTLFHDNARVVLDVQRQTLEEVNTHWGRGVSPEGERWFNGRYPGLVQGDPAPYPYADEGTNFGPGTTDADTDTGDGVQVLSLKLIDMGYLDPQPPYAGVYSDRMGEAVADLARDAGLSDNETMTINKWNALWDLDVTGYTATNARIVPLLQESAVRKWDLTGNGSYKGHNDGYDKNVRRRDRMVDFGRMSKADAITWVRGDHTKANETPNWVGTIRLNGVSGFAGEHANPTGLDETDIYEYWRMRAGQNVRVPYFDGGTIFHISGAEQEDGGVTLHVDTRARDLMDVTELQARNSDARRNNRREWRVENRGAKPSGNLITFDEFGGKLTQDINLVGGQWNVFQVPMGQHGQVNRTNFKVVGDLDVDGGDGPDTSGWCMAVVSRNWTKEKFQSRIGDPYPVDDDGETVWSDQARVDLYDDGILLYSAGTGLQPCGYWPKKHTNDRGDTTAADITGRWRDDGQWAYIMPPDRQPVITVGIYPATDAVLKAGRLFLKQEDDAV